MRPPDAQPLYQRRARSHRNLPSYPVQAADRGTRLYPRIAFDLSVMTYGRSTIDENVVTQTHARCDHGPCADEDPLPHGRERRDVSGGMDQVAEADVKSLNELVGESLPGRIGRTKDVQLVVPGLELAQLLDLRPGAQLRQKADSFRHRDVPFAAAFR